MSQHQKEIIFTLRREKTQKPGDYPLDFLQLFGTFFNLAEQGQLGDVGDSTFFGEPGSLGSKNFVASVMCYPREPTVNASKMKLDPEGTVPEPEGIRWDSFDMDGVLYAADVVIRGAVETAAWVRTQGIPHLFVTNTTSRSRAPLAEKLLAFGIPAHEMEILTPFAAVAHQLRTQPTADIALFLRPSARLEFADLPCLPDNVGSCASHVVVGALAISGTPARSIARFACCITTPRQSS